MEIYYILVLFKTLQQLSIYPHDTNKSYIIVIIQYLLEAKCIHIDYDNKIVIESVDRKAHSLLI